MDSADHNPLREILARQGVMLGRHESHFSAINHSMEQLSKTLSSVTSQLQQMQLGLGLRPSPDITQDPQPTHTAPSVREPRLPPPESYGGEPGTCRAFLSQCSLVFELQPATFPTDRARIAYVITLLTGRAREWGTAVWDTQAPFCSTYKEFCEEMRRVFDRSQHGREAARELLRVRQGGRSVSDYAIQFRTLAATTDWNTQAQYDAFLNGLSEVIKDELATRELPSDFQALVDLAIRIDSRIKQRHREYDTYSPRELAGRAFHHLPVPETPRREPPTPASPAPEPMQVDRTRLTQSERRRRRATNSCLYCGQPGHYVTTCPVKDSAHP